MRHLTCEPTTKTLGANVLTFFHSLRDVDTARVMEKHGLASVGQDDWVPASRFLDALNDLAQSADFVASLMATGMETGARFPIPFKDPSLGDVYAAINEHYQGLHRGVDVGTIACEKVGETHYKMTLTDLYPDDLSYGILNGYARRFLPSGTPYAIAYDLDEKPRDRGGNTGRTMIHVKWD